jgi:GAF domain-containing protein
MFIDDDRQWFKVAIGTEFFENTREDSFCTFVLPQPDELLIIPDVREDNRSRNNPLVVNLLDVNFYAGVALKSREGLLIDTLCVCK